MTRIILSGVNGKMGKTIEDLCEGSDKYEICSGIDVNLGIPHRFPTVTNPNKIEGAADVLIDFSHHTAVGTILEYAVKKKLPVVIATTGHTEQETEIILDAAKYIPIFKSANMSVGVNLMIELCKKAAAVLSDFDIEIIEKHHNQKLDAPSGTALMIADGINSVQADKKEYIYDRTKERKKRGENEIGIHSVRGGTIVGEHEVIYAGNEEIVTISHSALSREIFARGALKASEFIVGKPCGMYSMPDLIADAI